MPLEQAGKTSGAETAPMGDGAAKPAGSPGKHTLVEKLAKPAKSVGELRAGMSSTPALGADIARFFAEGNEDASLNGLLGQAYAVGASSATETAGADKTAAPIAEKAGTGAGATLPPARNDSK